ncbi:adenylosuccinate lyase [Candidatus Parcubacteria bacterium]|nr:MAG: adenylosuccinate lyase [Candidatus Parcubacteria bacterium]
MSQEIEKFPLTPLTAISPLDGRYWGKVSELSPFASEFGLIRARFEVEARYLVELSKVGIVRPLGQQEVEHLLALGPSLTLEQGERVKQIEDTTRHDVKAVERGFRELLAGTSMEDLSEYVHIFLTSEDVNNLSYRLLTRRGTDRVIIPALDALTDHIMTRADQYKYLPMMARTHGQEAVPTTLGKELAVYGVRINEQTRALEKHLLKGKLNGAVGNFNSFAVTAPEVDWIAFSKRFVESVGFEPNLFTTQINPYDDFVELFQIYQRANGVVLDLDQDAWRYISDHYLALQAVKGEVGSSTMPQKVNPIDFENSEGNLKFANGVLQVFITALPISRLQRDLSDSTLIRNVGVGLAHSLLSYKNTLAGFKRVSANEYAIAEALNKDWGILGEPVQQVLRMQGVEDPYTLVTNFVRGRHVSAEDWKSWITTNLPQGISSDARRLLQDLTPQNYLGYAVKLTDMAQEQIRSSRR